MSNFRLQTLEAGHIFAAVKRLGCHLATCPKRSGNFQKYQLLGFMLDRCENCEGIWLNKGELDALLRQQARGPLAIFLDRCFATTETQKSN